MEQWINAGRGERNEAQETQMLSSEIRATLGDHVLVHGMLMAEAGQRVQVNVSRFTVASVIPTFRVENRQVIYLLLLTVIIELLYAVYVLHLHVL